jgi:hypothetical protein
MRGLGVVHFIPGHGDVMSLRDVTALREAIARFRDGVKAGYKRGQGEAEIRKSLDLAAWEKLERAYVLGRNINRAYLEAEAESFDE